MTKFQDNQSPYLTVVEQVSKPTAPASGNQVLYIKTDHKLYHEDSGGTETEVGGGSGSAATGWGYPQDFRLTLGSGSPVTTADQANKTTLYCTPYSGNSIALYDGASTWNVRTSAEFSLNMAAFTASKPYDIFCYDNSGTPTLEGLVWTNATTRATALAYQNGILVKSGATTRRYLGTVYIDSGQKCQDEITKRYVWNYYNRILRRLFKSDATSHTYNSTTVRQWNNSATNQVSLVIGVQEGGVQIQFSAQQHTEAVSGPSVDATNALDTEIRIIYVKANGDHIMEAGVSGAKDIAAGYHYIAAVEAEAAGSTTGTYVDYYLNAQAEM